MLLYCSVNKPKTDIQPLIDRIEEQIELQKDSIGISQLFHSGLALRRAAILAVLFGAAMAVAGITVCYQSDLDVIKLSVTSSGCSIILNIALC